MPTTDDAVPGRPRVTVPEVRELLRRPEMALFVAVFAAYAYFYQAGGWNQNSRFDLVRATVEHGSASIDAYHGNTNDKAKVGDHYYCDKAPGVSWMAAPAYAVARLVATPPAGDSIAEARFLAVAAYVSTAWAIGVPSAISVVALALLLGALGAGERTRLAAAAAYGLGTLAFPYSTLLYGHQVAAAFTLCAFALLVHARRVVDRAEPLLLAGAGALLGGAVVVEYPAALAAVAITAYAATFVRPLHRLGWLAAGAALPCAALALYHAMVFGGPLTLPYEFSTQKNRSRGFFMGLGVPDATVLWHVLLSPYRGLFFSSPWLALSLPGAVRMVRVRAGALRAEAITCIAIALLHLWLNASLVDWQGGRAMGARYLVPCLPFVAILAAALALPGTSTSGGTRALRRAAWALAAAAALCSTFLMLAGTAVKPEVPVRERHPFGGYILPRLAKGRARRQHAEHRQHRRLAEPWHARRAPHRARVEPRPACRARRTRLARAARRDLDRMRRLARVGGADARAHVFNQDAGMRLGVVVAWR